MNLRASHQPFHWYVDFYPLMAAGGFDVVIGNPPYLEFRQVDYRISGYETIDTKESLIYRRVRRGTGSSRD